MKPRTRSRAVALSRETPFIASVPGMVLLGTALLLLAWYLV